MDGLADRYLTNFDVKMVYRTDRFGRGGDQVPLLEAGYPAVRVTEAVENYDRQHQTCAPRTASPYGDTIEGVDFAYLAQVTRLNTVPWPPWPRPRRRRRASRSRARSARHQGLVDPDAGRGRPSRLVARHHRADSGGQPLGSVRARRR
jgi:hypothetical protein